MDRLTREHVKEIENDWRVQNTPPRGVKSPPGWKKVCTGIADARKWVCMAKGCWVTWRKGESILHVGVHGVPNKYLTPPYTVQSAINEIDRETQTLAQVNA